MSPLAPLRAALLGALALAASPHARPAPPTPVLVGTVRDAATGAPLPAAELTAAGARTRSRADGGWTLPLPGQSRGATVTLEVRRFGYATLTRAVRLDRDTVVVALALAAAPPVAVTTAVAGSTVMVAPAPAAGAEAARRLVAAPLAATLASPLASQVPARRGGARGEARDSAAPLDREGYAPIAENPFLGVAANPRSTFSIDVDRAAYGNVRRFVTGGQRPPADAVRIEELVNYFPYALPAPNGADPVSITTDVMPAPWRPAHQLVRIALQARRIATDRLPPATLVFLLDVSGSMNDPAKLPLVKQALRLLVDQLRPQDQVAIVVYAGAAGVVLPATSGREKARIAEALDRLEAGGSTAGGAGLRLAYRVAQEARRPGDNVRVILATDGDFNVGESSDAAMVRLIEEQRASGTALTVLGFGTGNYQDAKMELLAKHGDGNYAYVDDLAEARKVFLRELGATLVTVARDVKLQVEFNPAAVRAYRLIGYEDRLLRDEDFADDRKDAGDLGAGHTVTALYEVVPAGVPNTVEVRGTAPLRYGAPPRAARGHADELLQVQLRYKPPTDSASRLLTHVVRARDAVASVDGAPRDARFAAAVAEWGMLLRASPHRGAASAEQVLALARGALGPDDGGYRAEFVRLVERWAVLSARDPGVASRP